MIELQNIKLPNEQRSDKELMKRVKIVDDELSVCDINYDIKDIFSNFYILFYKLCYCKCKINPKHYLSFTQFIYYKGFQKK